MARLGATASKPWKSSGAIKLTHCPLAINPTDAVAVGDRCPRKGVECRRHRSVGHRPASRHPARAPQEIPRPRIGSPPLRSQTGDSPSGCRDLPLRLPEQLGGCAVVECRGLTSRWTGLSATTVMIE